ncbi:ECF-type sigma factor [Lysobacter brunescens]|uniref:ECF-type sigma factor n=1 Tax=Lysobacter brunescens TaxID=262323 RepID=A0ABW2Y8E0_9GAMM
MNNTAPNSRIHRHDSPGEQPIDDVSRDDVSRDDVSRDDASGNAASSDDARNLVSPLDPALLDSLGLDSPESVTRLIADARSGQGSAWDRVYSLLYDDLHRIARSQIRQRTFGQISATSLVSEGWLRLVGAQVDVESRKHYVALVARAMRYVLMDEVRKGMAVKRGQGQADVPLDEGIDAGGDFVLEEMIALDAALTRLSAIDPRLGQLVEMRYFGGLDEMEIAEALGITDRTVRRDWRKARAFLLTQLGDLSPRLLRDGDG